jgi:two-component system, response regulator PdtaR
VRVLVVEDEYLIAMVLADMLVQLGHEVIGPASDKSEALAIAADATVALVDVRLADGPTGPQVAAVLKQQHNIAVVFTTGNPEAVYASHDGVAVITKPYDEQAIAQAIAYACAIHEGREMPVPPKLTRIPISM